MKHGAAKVGDRVIEDWDFGDREARVGTVKRIQVARYGMFKGGITAYIRWDEDAWPKCTVLPEGYLRRISDPG